MTTITHTTTAEIRDRLLSDLRRQLIRAGISAPNVAAGSERYIRSEALAAAVMQVVAQEVALQDSQMPDTAEGEDLDRLCSFRGLTRSPGAGATGDVVASCSGTVTYPVDLEWKTADGLRYKVLASTTATSGTLIPVVGVDTGKRTNKAASTVGTWSSPPTGSATTAIVGPSGLTNGADGDNDARLRKRLLDRLRYPPRGGNWSHVAVDAEAASAGIEKAFVYPGLYGPATMHVAITVAAEESTYYNRVASSALLTVAANAVTAGHPEHADITMTAVSHYELDLILRAILPEPTFAGGVGGGWKNSLTTPAPARWPKQAICAASPYAVRLAAAPTTSTIISVTSDDAPVVDAYFAIWSSAKQKFVRTRVKSYTGSGPYTIVLHTPIDVTEFVSGDYLSPDAERIDEYGKAVAQAFALLGPGQKTTTAALLPRSYRHPLVQQDWPTDYTSKHLAELTNTFAEMIHVQLLNWRAASTNHSTLPISTPASTGVGTAPNILKLGKFAIYEV